MNNGCKNNIRSLRLRGIILQSRKSGQAAGTPYWHETGSWNRQTYHPTIQHCIRSFEPYLAANRRTEKPVIHISLNPHPDDVLTDEQLTAISKEYMEKMGYGNQPYIIYRHEDIGNTHIHIVSLRIDEQGKKIKDYKEWQRSTAVCRELERKYHLLPAEKMERRESLPLTAVDYRKGDIKHQIANVVKPVMQGYKFQSVKEFKALLGLFHVTVEEYTRR
ncbi:relaxase/mobilization nuclease domain-containing protein [Bacteroides ovatus]|nr:relaxase/mobilization nuclease domain-containing protein [Bacteroides ovatus]